MVYGGAALISVVHSCLIRFGFVKTQCYLEFKMIITLFIITFTNLRTIFSGWTAYPANAKELAVKRTILNLR